jgi:hypothetical protein
MQQPRTINIATATATLMMIPSWLETKLSAESLAFDRAPDIVAAAPSSEVVVYRAVNSVVVILN